MSATRTPRPHRNEIPDHQGILGLLCAPARSRAPTGQAFLRWRQDQGHPSLAFKRVHSSEPIYSVRVSLGYRALGLRERDLMTWFWIGSHTDYERKLHKS
ncbi:MAG: hypothetical protein ACREJ0_24200 [Geminicoccaceae bacterium]